MARRLARWSTGQWIRADPLRNGLGGGICDEPTAHEPAAHDPAAHEPAAHDPAAHDPAAHDPAALGNGPVSGLR
ncbi:MAG: hypothetical protein ACYDCI_08160 [Candidatus Limnocylindrales bacterium]